MARVDVCSEVAGTVWKVLASVGDQVEEDATLLILESMKMEIPVEAPCSGQVVQILIAPQDGVEEDQRLIVLES